MSLGTNLQSLREAKRWKQEDLAHISGVSLTQISKIERDKTDPRGSTIVKIANALGCSADNLLSGTNPLSLDGRIQEILEKAQKLRPRDKAVFIEFGKSFCMYKKLATEFIQYRDGYDDEKEENDEIHEMLLQEEEEKLDALVKNEELSESAREA